METSKCNKKAPSYSEIHNTNIKKMKKKCLWSTDDRFGVYVYIQTSAAVRSDTKMAKKIRRNFCKIKNCIFSEETPITCRMFM